MESIIVREDIVNSIYEAEVSEFPSSRAHLGCSEIGKECERALWHSFHWSDYPNFNGRMLRLFQRGHEEEPRLAKALKSVGFTVREGEQERVEIFPHFSGSIDGIATFNGVDYVLEYKTHNDKSFKALKKKGVQLTKPEHYSQMQCYMGAYGLLKALYIAVNKNDDELYIEEIDFNDKIYQGLKKKAERILFGWSVPPIVYDPEAKMSPCKFCNFKEICHEGKEPRKNCRTCGSCVIKRDGSVYCERKQESLSVDKQREGCDQYIRFNE